ncbi:MAG: DNA repair protein RecN [Verrucomicrobiia bacterium]
MLTTLRIRNLALVEDLTVELRPGYNAITGETGAGKSILIGALNLVLGERADRTLIRSGADSCAVEAVFDVRKQGAPISTFLDENGLEPCEEGLLVLKRTFSAAGTNRQFINGSPATLAVLAGLGEWLVDIHGPHDHQSLLHPAPQLGILDAFGGLTKFREDFARIVRKRNDLETEKRALVMDERTFIQQLDLLRFQVNEIKAAKLRADEEPELQEAFQRANNAARLVRLSQAVLGVLGEEENSVLQQAAILGRTVQELHKIDPGAAELADLHTQAVTALQELQRAATAYADRLEIDPIQLQELEERLNLIQGLKRKYGSSVREIIEFGEAAQQKKTALEQRDAELLRINQELDSLGMELRKAGEELSNQRRKVIPKLVKAVVKQLGDLGFKQSRIDITLSGGPPKPGEARVLSSGFDTVDFQFAPNPGEEPRPLRAIASSGELARVMLALKTVLAGVDQIPVLVFDEVDANVGGETARAVGDKMRQIAKERQVLCVTHLAPVAAAADAHYVVTKETTAGRTVSNIQMLERGARVKELARMLGGQSEAARLHAEELLRTR